MLFRSIIDLDEIYTACYTLSLHDALPIYEGSILEFVYPVLGHPSMRPEPGHVILISFLYS